MSGPRHLTPRRRAILKRAPTPRRTMKIMEGGTAGTTTRRNNSDARDHGGGRHSNSDDSNKHDSGHKHGGGTLDFEPSSIAHEVFGAGAAGKFGPGDSFHFKGKVPGSEASDAINLVDLDPTPASISHHGSSKGTSGPLAIFEEAIDLSSSSHHSSDHHGNSPDHERHVISHVQHDLMV